MQQAIRAVVLERLSITRQAFSHWLEMSGRLAVSAVSTEGELWSALDREKADLVLLRCPTVSEDVAATVAKVKACYPTTRAAILCAESSTDDLCRAIRSGADGFFVEWMNAEHFLWNLENVVSQGIPFYPSRTVHDLVSHEPAKGVSLSSQEASIMSLVSRGRTNEEISRTLFISSSTVKRHLQSAYQKLCARNRAEAVNRILELGIRETIGLMASTKVESLA